MNQMFADMADVCVLVYHDDILIFSKNEQKHQQHMHVVFKRLAQNSLYIKCKKCTLFIDSIEFLGHIVLQHGIEVFSNKIAAIKNWPVSLLLMIFNHFQVCAMTFVILFRNLHIWYGH